ncbi:hypothetical protein D3C76_1826910 [compost metagenome]
MKRSRRKLLFTGQLGLETPLLVMLHDHIDPIPHLRVEFPELGKLADRKQQLPA